jgi:hypothetical protein
MDETQLNEILASYRDAINALIERADVQDEMIKAVREKSESVEKLIFDEVINPATEAMNQSIYESGLADFSERHGSKLSAYNEPLKAIEGDDFDIMKKAYDGYKELPEGQYDEESYVDELVKSLDEQLNNIREKLGISSEAKVEVKQEDGETKVEVEGKDVTEELESKEEPTEKGESEAKPDEVVEETVEKKEDESEDESDESDPEDLKKLEEELLAYAK